MDEKRAGKLEATVKRIVEKAAKNPNKGTDPNKTDTNKKTPEARPATRIRLINEWKEPVTVVVGGVAYFLRVGETRLFPKPPGSFTYEVQVRQHWSRGTVEAGKTFTIRIRDR
jgi:hypothetical protein